MSSRSVELTALIPSDEEYEKYISRTINGKWDLDILEYARGTKHNVLLFGPTGSAKTTAARAYAAREKLPFYSVPCNGAIEPSQLFGKWVPTVEAGRLEWMDGPVTKLVRDGGVLLVDEVNFATSAFLSVLHPLLDARRVLALLDHEGEVIRAHPEFQVIAAYNPRYRGTRPLNEAFLNRFAIKLPFPYLPEVEKELIHIAPTLIDVATQLRRSQEAGELNTPISTNMLMEFEDFAADLGYAWASENFLSAFQPEERGAVKNVLELHQDELIREFQVVDATVENYDDDFAEVATDDDDDKG